MSSGFFGFFAHAGFMSALEAEGLEPAAILGSSAGALVGGAWAAGLSAREFSRVLLDLRRQDFWDPGPGGGLLRGELFHHILCRILPSRTFAGCRVPVAMSVFHVPSARTRVLRSGDLVRAVRASCAVPFLFHPVAIDGAPHLDGGLFDRPGLRGAQSGERVLYHHLASRSPWRRPGSPALRPPCRTNSVSLVLPDLPRVGPFRLERGAAAFREARERTLRALDAPVSPVLVSS